MAKQTVEETTYVPLKSLDLEGTPLAKSKVNEKKKVSTKKAPAKKVAKKKVTAKKDKGPSKSELAIAIFKKHFGKKERKEIIALFQSEAKLTKAGANTYFANIKRKHEDGEL